MPQNDFVSIPGSERHPVRGAQRIGPAQPDEPLEVIVRVRRRSPLPGTALSERRPPAQRTYLSHTQLEAAHGADPADITSVEAFARQNGLTIVESNPRQDQ